jgi:hypothetical protein
MTSTFANSDARNGSIVMPSNMRRLATAKNATTRRCSDSFDDEINNHLLFIGWHDYANAIGKLPIEAQMFQIWYLALYPDKLNSNVARRPFEKAFPDLNAQSPSMRKEVLRRKIASSLADLALMSDPRTDTRPLILPAR